MAITGHSVTILTSTGDVVPNAPIEIRLYSTSGLANIFEQDGTPITQTGATADDSGIFRFWAEPNEYFARHGDVDVPVTVGVDDETMLASLSQAYEFDTVALMKSSAIAFPIGKKIKTKGYYTANDGGGASYLVGSDQAVDNWGDHDLSDGKVAKIDVTGAVSTRQYGAKLTVGVNDYNAVRAAFVSPYPLVISYGTSEIDWWLPHKSNKTIKYDGWLKVVSPRAFDFEAVHTMSNVLNGENTDNAVIINPQIDCNNAPAANGIILRDGATNCRVSGGIIKNCAHAKPSDGGYGGGRALNIEAGSGGANIASNNKIDGITIKNSYTALSVSGSNDSPEKNNSITNITAENCEILINLPGNGPTFPHDGDNAGCIITNITGFNVGKSVTYNRAHGIISGDRSSNAVINGVKVYNQPSYTGAGLGVGSVTRGEWSNVSLSNVDVTSALTDICNLNTFAELDSIAALKFGSRGNRFQITHHGTTADTVNYAYTYDPSLSGGTGDANPFNNQFDISTDSVTSGKPLPTNVASYPSMIIRIYEASNNAFWEGFFEQLQSEVFANFSNGMYLGAPQTITDGGSDRSGGLSIRSLAPTLRFKDTSGTSHWWEAYLDNNLFRLGISTDQGGSWAEYYRLAPNYIAPTTTNTVDLGEGPSRQWRDIYSQNSVTVNSDKRIKRDIKSIPQHMLDFAMSIEIKQYKYRHGQSGRNHYGLVVDDTLINLIKNTPDMQECAAFCHSVFKDENDVPIDIDVGGGVTIGDMWSVRYGEWNNILLEAMRRSLTYGYTYD